MNLPKLDDVASLSETQYFARGINPFLPIAECRADANASLLARSVWLLPGLYIMHSDVLHTDKLNERAKQTVIAVWLALEAGNPSCKERTLLPWDVCQPMSLPGIWSLPQD